MQHSLCLLVRCALHVLCCSAVLFFSLVFLSFSLSLSLLRPVSAEESPRNAIGVFGVRFGAGAGNGVLPSALYGKTLDFYSALDVLHTRNIYIAFNVWKIIK